MMAGNFSVMAASPDDLDAVARFLKSCGALPSRQSWMQIFLSTVGSAADGGQLGRNEARIVVDRNGAIRAFCILHRLSHAVHHELLDIPVLTVECGPNKDEISRLLFDHLVNRARESGCDTLRFWRSDASAWERWQRAGEEERGDIGMIVPLPSKTTSTVSISHTADTA